MLFLSLAGRIYCVKMSILPRFLYLFQCIPIFLTKSFFQNLDRLISSFIWGGKTPRIRKEFLQRQKPQGGLALPNFRYYYWAANISKVLYWLQIPKDVWCISEANSCTSSSLPALALSKLPLCISMYTRCPVVANTPKFWFQFRQCFGFKGHLLCKIHFYMVFEHKCVLAVCEQIHPVVFFTISINHKHCL